jgi:hypothetical protein
MINDDDPYSAGGALNDDNHSMGEPENLYVPGRCCNVIGYDPEEGDILCESPCNPAEQICHYCLTRGHRMTGLF